MSRSESFWAYEYERRTEVDWADERDERPICLYLRAFQVYSKSDNYYSGLIGLLSVVGMKPEESKKFDLEGWNIKQKRKVRARMNIA